MQVVREKQNCLVIFAAKYAALISITGPGTVGAFSWNVSSIPLVSCVQVCTILVYFLYEKSM